MLRGSTELIKEVEQSSILTGTSILGGLWTFMTGIFSFVFGIIRKFPSPSPIQ